MADFDQFTSAEQPPQEEDPAAEFLKREQEELAGLDDDNFVLETEAAPESTDEKPTAPAVAPPVAPPVAPESASESTGEVPTPDDTSPKTTAEEVSEPEKNAGIYENLGEMPDLGGDAFTAAPPPETQVTDSDLYSAIKMEDVTREEPERIKRWREEQNERLLKKDVESEEKKEQWQAVAVKELEDWYKHRQEQLDKTKISNRDGEAEFVRERDENIPGHEWERISRLCDFNPKGSRTTKDVSRMRSILLQLKQTPLVKSS